MTRELDADVDAAAQRVGLTRRRFLSLAGAAGVAVAGYTGHWLLEEAARADPGHGSLDDIEHVVLLMQENRSFDHYFGSMSGVRGFDDPSPHFVQHGWRRGVGPDPTGTLTPFRLDTRSHTSQEADILDDPAHDWRVQHESWNHGAMDRWLTAHAAQDASGTPLIMGYYTRADLPVHYGLADAFTVCDQYFSSVMGPTGPNRLYWMSATIDPHGERGGPITGHTAHLSRTALTWRTFPEELEDAGVSWKVYNSSPPARNSELTGMLRHFTNFQDTGSRLYQRGLDPRYPRDFVHDVAAGTLPSVSWIIPSWSSSEHPSFPSAVGAEGILQVLATLTANPAVWEKTLLIVSYDENGGFFDHVAPPVPTAFDHDETVVTRHAAAPIGLGFRVPCLLLSPYTRGGRVSSQVYDHTSQLRLVGQRFGVDVPNLTPWRRRTVGDMTEIFEGRALPNLRAPRFPQAAADAGAAMAGDATVIEQANRGRRAPLLLPPAERLSQESRPIRRQISS